MIFGLFLFNINALFTGDRKVEESVNVFALSYQSRSSYIWKHYKLIKSNLWQHGDVNEGGLQSFNMVPR